MTSYSSHKYPTIDGNPEVLDGTTYPSERASVLVVPCVPLSPSRSRTRATHVITQSPGERSMRIRSLLCASLFVIPLIKGLEAQEVPIPQLSPGTSRKSASTVVDKATPAPPQSIALNLPRGTPLQWPLTRKSE